ncbi:unnamed protein product, partial [Timema podura]|nr:unnamed protein product [Timema podura]
MNQFSTLASFQSKNDQQDAAIKLLNEERDLVGLVEIPPHSFSSICSASFFYYREFASVHWALPFYMTLLPCRGKNL